MAEFVRSGRRFTPHVAELVMAHRDINATFAHVSAPEHLSAYVFSLIATIVQNSDDADHAEALLESVISQCRETLTDVRAAFHIAAAPKDS